MIYFVGLHNKPGKRPLCSSTKSGKLIDRIVSEMKPTAFTKMNLYDVDYIPLDTEKDMLLHDFKDRISGCKKDVLVLLGSMVHNDCPDLSLLFGKVLKVAHPASKRSHKEMDEYVADVVEKINRFNK